jgi:bacterioferritin
MQAKPGVIDQLNTILTIELTAVNQYFLQAEMCRNWGYEHLYEKLRASSMEEMKDAERLIQHVLYLDGFPNVQRLNDIGIGENVLENLQVDLRLENGAVGALAQAISHCAQAGDFTTRNLLEEMIRGEEGQVDWLETQLEAIRQVGLQNYLTEQIR